MLICQLYEDLLQHHRSAVALYSDDTLELAATHQALIHDSWQSACEHHLLCPVCKETERRHAEMNKSEAHTAAWLSGGNRARAAAARRLNWIGYD